MNMREEEVVFGRITAYNVLLALCRRYGVEEVRAALDDVAANAVLTLPPDENSVGTPEGTNAPQ